MKPTTEQDYRQRILAALVHIQGHLDEAVSLEELAKVAHFSPYHFHRVFRGMVGESVMAHVRRLRIERGAYRLKFSEQPVTRIAFEAGYETHEAFTRAFKAMFDEAPSRFREIHRSLPTPAAESGVHYDPDGKVAEFAPIPAQEPPPDVRVEKVDCLRVAFMRHVGPYDQVTQTWGALIAWAQPRGLVGPFMMMLGITHDDPEVTPPDKIRYDACLLGGDDLEPEGDVGVQRIAAGDYAVARHRGPYEKLGDTYAHLCGQWLPTSGRTFRAGPGFEVYRNSPHDTPAENLVTDIHLPLES